jgi:hypothetical protein
MSERRLGRTGCDTALAALWQLDQIRDMNEIVALLATRHD